MLWTLAGDLVVSCTLTTISLGLRGGVILTHRSARNSAKALAHGRGMSCATDPSSPWVHGCSSEGHSYYYNTATGESSWTAPPEHGSSEVACPLTPSGVAAVAWSEPGASARGTASLGGAVADDSDLFGSASEGASELFGGAAENSSELFAENSSELFGPGCAPGSATFASAAVPNATFFGGATETTELFPCTPAPYAASALFGGGAEAEAGSELFFSAPAPAASALFGAATETAETEIAARAAFGTGPLRAHPPTSLVPPTPEVGQGYVAHRVQQLAVPTAAVPAVPAAPADAISVPLGNTTAANDPDQHPHPEQDPHPDQDPWIFGYSEQARRLHPPDTLPPPPPPPPMPSPRP